MNKQKLLDKITELYDELIEKDVELTEIKSKKDIAMNDINFAYFCVSSKEDANLLAEYKKDLNDLTEELHKKGAEFIKVKNEIAKTEMILRYSRNLECDLMKNKKEYRLASNDKLEKIRDKIKEEIEILELRMLSSKENNKKDRASRLAGEIIVYEKVLKWILEE